MWWLRTRSMGLAILLSAKSCCRLLWERWLHPLHLLGPVLLGCCRLQLTSLSSMNVLQPPLLCEGGVVTLCVCLGTVQYWWISIGLAIVQLRAVFCPSFWYLLFFSEALSWTIFDSSGIPLFHSGPVFHELVCLLSVVLSRNFINLTTLFSYPATQWGAADGEIKVPSVENTDLKGSPSESWSRSVYSHACYAYCQGFLPW